MKTRMPIVLVVASLLFTPLVLSQDYRAADEGQRPVGSATVIMPEKFLRGFDPVTVYFSSNQGPGKQAADQGPKILKIKPAWPGAWWKAVAWNRPSSPRPQRPKWGITMRTSPSMQ